jgi:4-nitrophenyl phosphatase
LKKKRKLIEMGLLIILKKYKGYLIDLDGTIYRGNEVIQGAVEFINLLKDEKIPYLFITNNSTLTQNDFAYKLNGMGIPATPDNVLTSSLATAKYIKHIKRDARCMVIGENGLYEALDNENLIITNSSCEYVVIGLDRKITYDKLTKAAQAIHEGAVFVSTNSDVAIPTEKGFIPGNGALTSVLTVSTGKEPIFIGKPEKIIMKEALKVLEMEKSEVLMVGDNYYTDIHAGMNSGIDTLMVFTGVTPKCEYPKFSKKPTYHVQNLIEWIKFIKNQGI